MTVAERTEFLRRRKQGIGGSDVAAICGISPWKTPNDIYIDKTTDTIVERDDERLKVGSAMEAYIADRFAQRHGVKVQKRNGQFSHKKHPELIANIDRYIIGGGILECKTCDELAADKFGDEPPDYYVLQVLHYMTVTGYRTAWLSVLIGNRELRDYRIEYDPVIAEFAAQKCIEFWRTFVLAKTPPPPSMGDDLSAYFTASPEKAITASPDLYKRALECRELRAEIRKKTEALEKLEFDLKTDLADAEVLLSPDGEKIATWKQGKERSVIDWKALALDFSPTEEQIAMRTQKKPGTRPLLFAKQK